MTFCKLQKKQGLVKTASIGAPFMNAANLCGLENLLKWMFKKPDPAHRLLRLVTDYGIQFARYWVETFGPENIEFRTSTPTSSNQVISPKHFKAFSLLYLKELHEVFLTSQSKALYTGNPEIGSRFSRSVR
jgi:uroporphyrinogen-III decarboxylase